MTNKIIINNESEVHDILMANIVVGSILDRGRLKRDDYGNIYDHPMQFPDEKLVVYAELRKSGTITFRDVDR